MRHTSIIKPCKKCEILVNDKFITTFLEKTNIFNEFFNLYQTLVLLRNPVHIIQKTGYANKAYDYDSISIKMLKLSNAFIIRHFTIIFQGCLKSGRYPDDWKKKNIVSIHKKY